MIIYIEALAYAGLEVLYLSDNLNRYPEQLPFNMSFVLSMNMTTPAFSWLTLFLIQSDDLYFLNWWVHCISIYCNCWYWVDQKVCLGFFHDILFGLVSPSYFLISVVPHFLWFFVLLSEICIWLIYTWFTYINIRLNVLFLFPFLLSH